MAFFSLMPVALSLQEGSLKDSTISVGGNYTVFFFDNFNLREKASGIFHLVIGLQPVLPCGDL